MGDFQPEAQVKGLAGCNLIALICNKNSATLSSISRLLYMPQNYRIYINTNTLTITENPHQYYENHQQVDNQNFDFLTFYTNQFKVHDVHFVLQVEDAKKALKQIKQTVSVIKAAGGVVSNPNHEYLLIFRNNKWDLPKGKIEKGEDKKEAAVREVEEECGVLIDRVIEKLDSTYHMYELNNEIILKKTYWYKMEVDMFSKLTPQIEEGITEVEWVSPKFMAQKMENTYPLIKEVISKMGLF